jgi:hypothetical protein
MCPLININRLIDFRRTSCQHTTSHFIFVLFQIILRHISVEQNYMPAVRNIYLASGIITISIKFCMEVANQKSTKYS